MKTKKYWTQPTIQEITVDNEISALMVSPPDDPFSSVDTEKIDNINADPFA